MKNLVAHIFIVCFFLLSCRATRNYDPNKMYSPEVLKSDLSLLKNILEQKHPSLYWYTSKSEMDRQFVSAFDAIKDSMTELQFGWKVIAPLTASIHCGHTSFSMSKGWQHFMKGKKIPAFPLLLKVWNDSMLVVANMNGDSLVGPGNFITSINGMDNRKIINEILGYLPADGFAENVNYIRMSSSFPYFHRNVFGLYKKYNVTYTDSNGVAHEALVNWWMPEQDSTIKEPKRHQPKLSANERRENVRSLLIDSNYAYMPVNAFSKAHLTGFFKKSFRRLHRKGVPNLIIDLRVNGGGDINKAVALTRYIRNTSFKVVDTATSVSKNFNPYSKYIRHSFWNNIALLFVSKKRADGRYHFGYWERHFFKPKKKNHYNGNVYVLTNGLTFSASTLFCNLVKGQPNVTLVGEETGGGWYGNSGILIPDITLPHTKLRVRLPFFRLVQYDHISFKGTGVIPDWYIGPNWRDVLSGRDTKLEAVKLKIEHSRMN